MRNALILICALAATACSNEADERSGGGTASGSTGAGSSGRGESLTAEGPLFRTAGLWETTTRLSGNEAPPQTSRACLDLKTKNVFDPLGKAMPAEAGCTAPARTAIPGGFRQEITCKSEGAAQSAVAEVTGDARRVVMRVTNRVEMPGMAPMSPGTIAMESRHVGPCPADMEPGDVIESDGSRGRVND